MTTHLASWGKMNFQRHKSKPPNPDSPGARESPRRSPGRSVSGIPADLTEKHVNNNYNQHSRLPEIKSILHFWKELIGVKNQLSFNKKQKGRFVITKSFKLSLKLVL